MNVYTTPSLPTGNTTRTRFCGAFTHACAFTPARTHTRTRFTFCTRIYTHAHPHPTLLRHATPHHPPTPHTTLRTWTRTLHSYIYPVAWCTTTHYLTVPRPLPLPRRLRYRTHTHTFVLRITDYLPPPPLPAHTPATHQDLLYSIQHIPLRG